MGFPLVNYFFKCDPFDLNFHFLVFCGFWPLKTKNKFLQKLFAGYSFLCCFSLISMLFIQILDLYLLRNDPITFTKNMCATTVTIGSIVKYLLVFYNVEEIERLYPAIKGFIDSVTDPDDVRVTKKAYKDMKQTIKAFFGLAVPCVLTWMIYPGLESSSKKNVPFPYRLPVDDWSTPVYEILYTYQSMSMIGFMIIILSNDLVFYGLVIKINAKFDILINKFHRLESVLAANKNNEEKDDERFPEVLYDPVVTKIIRKKIKECVLFHQQILEEANQLNKIYSGQSLAHFFTAVTVVGVIIIDVIVISKGFKLQMLQRVTYIANGVFDTFLLCYFLTEMQERGCEVRALRLIPTDPGADDECTARWSIIHKHPWEDSYKLKFAIYSTPWYKLNTKIRQDLLLLLARSNKPIMVLAGNYFPINLSTFLHLLKLTYNITALLYQMIRN